MSWINAGEAAYVVERAAGAERAREVVDELRGRVLLELPQQERVLTDAGIKARHTIASADALACALHSRSRTAACCSRAIPKSSLPAGDPEIRLIRYSRGSLTTAL